MTAARGSRSCSAVSVHPTTAASSTASRHAARARTAAARRILARPEWAEDEDGLWVSDILRGLIATVDEGAPDPNDFDAMPTPAAPAPEAGREPSHGDRTMQTTTQDWRTLLALEFGAPYMTREAQDEYHAVLEDIERRLALPMPGTEVTPDAGGEVRRG